jgi:hypothetical protein
MGSPSDEQQKRNTAISLISLSRASGHRRSDRRNWRTSMVVASHPLSTKRTARYDEVDSRKVPQAAIIEKNLHNRSLLPSQQLDNRFQSHSQRGMFIDLINIQEVCLQYRVRTGFGLDHRKARFGSPPSPRRIVSTTCRGMSSRSKIANDSQPEGRPCGGGCKNEFSQHQIDGGYLRIWERSTEAIWKSRHSPFKNSQTFDLKETNPESRDR